jgi:glycosyltransferase involved in cell wall biosynthesis
LQKWYHEAQSISGAKSMKVAIIHQPTGPIWTSGTSGSVSIWVYEIARRLARSCQTVVYARRGQGQPDKENHEGVEYRRISTTRDELRIRLLKKLTRFRRKDRPLFVSRLGYRNYISTIARDLKEEKCDIIHVVNFPNFAPVVRAHNPGIPIVLHMHGEWLTQFDSSMVEGWLSKTDFILSVSEFVSQGIRSRFPRYASRCQTIYMGVDPDQFGRKRGFAGTKKKGAQRLLYVGRISPEKGVHVLLEAFQLVVRHLPETTLRIVGPEWLMPREHIVELSSDHRVLSLGAFYNGSYLSFLKKQVPANVAHQVNFIDLIVHEKISSQFDEADLYVNPSFSESLGMSIIEAMASELPVVATRVGGVPELVEEDETGILVEPGDAAALAQAIIRLLADESLRERMGRRAVKRAVELFSWDHICHTLLDKYQNIVRGGLRE